MIFRAFPIILLPLMAMLGFSSCTYSGVTPSPAQSTAQSPAVAKRDAMIRTEPTGDYFIGRRYVTERTRFWGYVRRPRQTWDSAKLVIMNESKCKSPDRLEEGAAHGFGFDHNYEYRLFGRFSGKTMYDPNSNYFLPEFVLESYELISEGPGFLFRPGVRYDSKALPPRQ